MYIFFIQFSWFSILYNICFVNVGFLDENSKHKKKKIEMHMWNHIQIFVQSSLYLFQKIFPLITLICYRQGYRWWCFHVLNVEVFMYMLLNQIPQTTIKFLHVWDKWGTPFIWNSTREECDQSPNVTIGIWRGVENRGLHAEEGQHHNRVPMQCSLRNISYLGTCKFKFGKYKYCIS